MQHERSLIVEIDQGGGPLLAQGFEMAAVSPPKRSALVAELRDHPEIYRLADNRDRLDVEAMTVAVMVYGS